jgi:hypothetical protein
MTLKDEYHSGKGPDYPLFFLVEWSNGIFLARSFPGFGDTPRRFW